MKRKWRNSPQCEGLKTLCILLLSGCAVYLVLQIKLPLSPHQPLSPTANQPAIPPAQEPWTAAGHLRRMAVTTEAGGDSRRYGVQYDQGESDLLFQQLYGLLVEGISSAGIPHPVEETVWQQALIQAPGVYWEWQGQLPLEVLEGWLGVSNPNLQGTVSQLLLVEEAGAILLYYCDPLQGKSYVCTAAMVNPGRLEEITSNVRGNGATFALEQGEFQGLAPHTMILPTPPSPKVYLASNPLHQPQALAQLRQVLHFSSDALYYYNALEEQVIRHDNDTLRISSLGIVTYEADEGSSRLQVPGSSLYEGVEYCRQLAEATLGVMSGEGRLYLYGVSPSPQGGWLIEFGYMLNGSPVYMTNGVMGASFLLSDEVISGFRLVCRRYEDSGATSLVLPERQAAAALEASLPWPQDLVLLYPDVGEDQVTAVWGAIPQGKE